MIPVYLKRVDLKVWICPGATLNSFNSSTSVGSNRFTSSKVICLTNLETYSLTILGACPLSGPQIFHQIIRKKRFLIWMKQTIKLLTEVWLLKFHWIRICSSQEEVMMKVSPSLSAPEMKQVGWRKKTKIVNDDWFWEKKKLTAEISLQILMKSIILIKAYE